MKKVLISTVILMFIVSMYACRKRIVEIIAVADRNEYYVGKPANLKHVDFPSSKVGYVAEQKNGGTIFNTIDGGKNWTDLSVISADAIDELKFMNDNVGFYKMRNKIMRTTDGGQTWGNTHEGNGIVIVNDSSAIILQNKVNIFPGFLFFLVIWQTQDYGETYTVLDTVNWRYGPPWGLGQNYTYKIQYFEPNKLIFVPYNTEEVYIYHIDSEDTTNTICCVNGEIINDIYYFNSTCGIGVGNNNTLVDLPDPTLVNEDPNDAYDYHSIAGWGDNFVAISDSIMSVKIKTKKSEWYDILDYDGSNLSHNKLNAIDFKTPDVFMVVGDSGLVWEVKYDY
jgi:hypothetical protein